MNQELADSDVEKTLAESEALIRKAEDMSEQGNRVFQSLGIPRGSARKILDHPLASDALKKQGLEQLRQWQEEVADVMKSGSRTVVVKRRKSNRNLLAI
ncbi:hypothetical protein BTA51_14240 [Hahella sp. CCB-MM4]|uniref:hypothetical protein n=1 Tax=Hahella sp. (strain CCB-MM4) TaxID=1926491 RepID=UPI000B9B36E6|nr:hypothetical protein [Hahella sp. CCB-MM4]OZG72685.1 hypothetical protein BTA51_14240 [Hahella sp. CCB-MM4]